VSLLEQKENILRKSNFLRVLNHHPEEVRSLKELIAA